MSMSLNLPEGIHPGAIIGKKGANVKKISATSGARVSIDSEKRIVSFRGNPAQVKKARDMVQQQIKDFLSQPNTSPYPCFTAMNLSRDFEDSPKNPGVRFKSVHSPEDTKRDRKEQMYRLDLAASDELSNIFGKSLSLGGGGSASKADLKNRCFYSKTESNEATMAYLKVASEAVEFDKPGFGKFEVIKLRINFGAQLFYSRTTTLPQHDMAISDALRLTIGYDCTMNSCFSNLTLPTTVDRVRKLLPKFGFAPSGTSNTVVCHTRDKANNNYKICFKFEVEDGDANKAKLKLLKVRTGYAKIALVGFVYPAKLSNDQIPDYRVRLLGEYSVSKEVNDEAAVLTKGATWIQANKKIESKLNERYDIELIRHKKKTYYTGEYQGMKIGVALVDVGDDIGNHSEIEVSFRVSADKPTDHAAFNKIVAFCDALRNKIVE